MYACIPENGGGFFAGCAHPAMQPPFSATHATLPFAKWAVQAPVSQRSTIRASKILTAGEIDA